MKLAIYGHGGSQNHGNEAIVRGVRALFPDAELITYTFAPEVDRHFGLDEVCELRSMTRPASGQRDWFFTIAKVLRRFFPTSKLLRHFYYNRFFAPFIQELTSDTIYLLEAGDQYCEPGDHRWFYGYLNKKILKAGAKSVMMGCTVNPSVLEDESVVQDIGRYSAVIARESITYRALKEKNVSKDLHFAPCPAFSMEAEKFDLPAWMAHKEFVGFNVGFLAQGNEKYYELLMRNFETAIRRIIEETDLDVALIPHVNWDYRLTDFTALDVLWRKFRATGRIHYIEEHNAAQQKFVIAQCKAMVALRTHATIPGLASYVPTLIAGYKTKSRGIANDIFGEKFDMLADVQSLTDENTIADKLFGILDKHAEILAHYRERMPEYMGELKVLVEAIAALE